MKPNPAEPLISLRDIRFGYPGGDPVLNGVNLDLQPGRKLALTGANGSGKTTLLHIIVGLIRPDGGTIRAFGRERRIEEDFFQVRAEAGLLFQDAEDQLFCPTVIEDVAFGPLNLGLSREEALTRAEEILNQLGLIKLKDRVCHRLSGGEKRLAALAAVLAMEPKALLLDEPTTGLDESGLEKVTAILTELDLAMLIVSHRPRFREAVADSRIHLSGGKLA